MRRGAAACFLILGTGAQAEEVVPPGLLPEVTARVTPAVVNISTRRSQRRSDRLQEIFGGPRRGPELGAGSGVVVSADGTILTNNHVIEDADEIQVSLPDKREFAARLIGTDPPSDVAVLKIDAKGLPVVPLGDSDALRLGEVVLAIGNPFGIGQTVTMGIVSAKGRANIGMIDYEDFIQTDAAINPGNSGGALVNLKGELVGINTVILSKSGGSQGIGLAVPSNMVRPIRDQILAHGRVRRGWFGAVIQDLTPELARSLGLDEVSGVLASDVLPDTPAAKGKIKPDDVVLEMDGKPTRSTAELRNAVALMAPGSKVKVLVLRGKKRLELPVVLEEKQAEAGPIRPREEPLPRSLLDGLEIEEVDARQRTRLQLPPTLKGVVVSDVEDGSAAALAELAKDDVITRVERKNVASEAELRKLVPDGAAHAVLRVLRGQYYIYVLLKR